MLLFAHTGITLGLAYGLDKYLSINAGSSETGDLSTRPPIQTRLASIAGKIDYRIVLIGSMLPDIIDKPLGIYLFGSTFDNGRIVCHTLLFLIILFTIGIYRFRKHAKTGWIVLSFGVFTHLVLDEMWNAPHTLFWPIDGSSFPHKDVEDFIGLIWENMTTEPKVYIGEIIGLSVLIPIGFRLLMHRHIIQFIGKGTLI